MKFPSLLLAGSLAANAALVTWWLTQDRASAPVAHSGVRSTASYAASTSSSVSLATLPPVDLRAHLTSLGLPPEAINALVRSRIYARHDARRRELLAAAAQSSPWWKSAHPTGPGDPLRLLTPAQRKGLHDLDATARAETLALLGPTALDPDGKIAARYPFLTPEKAVLLEALETDYRNFASEHRDETRGLRTPADREKEKLLATERQRDLAALLSPAEWDMLNLRTSSTASRLSERMMTMQATEEEYRAIYPLQKTFEEKFPSAYAPGGAAGERPTFVHRAELDQQIRAVLSPERFADWESSSQIHASALSRLALVNNLTAHTVRDVTALMTATADRSWRIAEDPALPTDQRAASLAQLARDARAQVSAKLGPDTATAYLREVFWIDTIARGGAVRLHGGSVTIRYGDTPAPNAPPRQ